MSEVHCLLFCSVAHDAPQTQPDHITKAETMQPPAAAE